MTKKYKNSIFIFRRDFRLNDNIGLIESLKNSEKVLPIFIFTPEQLENNKYKSDNCVQFMVESLEDLDKRLKAKNSKLFLFYGKPHIVINKLIKNEKIDAIFINRDYTPYAKKRDREIEKVCNSQNVIFEAYEDILLNPVGSIKTTSGTVYSKFTPYFNKAKKEKVLDIQTNKMKNYFSSRNRVNGQYKKDYHKFYEKNDNLDSKGGRSEGLKILMSIKKFNKYNEKRNCLNFETTHLSAYIKFGCVSIREVYHSFKNKLGTKNDLVKQLYWRDFYYNVGFCNPIIFSKKGNLKTSYDKIKWYNDRTLFNKWKEGETGFPIVDACMRQMNKTGFMHNRGRLIVSSFLIKILLIDWKWGEKYFANKLQDYDMSVNTGNWGWASGSGADSQPYFRIFNPWLQSEKYDPNGNFIKKWIPELKDVESKHLHKWDKFSKKYNKKNISEYPNPIVDYKKQKEKALKMYKKAFK